MKCIKSIVLVALALSLAACGGGDDLSIELPGGGTRTLKLDFPSGIAVEHRLPFRISGGVPPYNSSIEGCPEWVTLFPDQGILAGTGPAVDSGRTFFCTYHISDSSVFKPASTSFGLRLTVRDAATRPLTLSEPIVRGGDPVRLTLHERASVPFSLAYGGVAPLTYDLQCALPQGLGFSSVTRTLSGTPLEIYRGPDCTYRVIDSATPPASVSRDFELIVDPLDKVIWRFRTRTLARSDHPVSRTPGLPQMFVTLPHAIGGTGIQMYKLLDLQSPLKFDEVNRQLSYHHTGVDPLFDTPTTFRYQVSGDEQVPEVHDTLCVDISFHDKRPAALLDDLLDTVSVSIRDDAYFDSVEYRCPDASPRSASSSRATLSNPVHSALAPIHARRAVNVAHAAVRDRVRGWSPGAPRLLSAISPAVSAGSLSGQSEGFDYTGSSVSLSTGAELGADSWQAGLVTLFTRTDLHYRAEAGLSERGYHTGEHNTEILSLHPFAAWHAPSGTHLWASLGAGIGHLRHRDDLGFLSWSRSDVRLSSHAVGASVPLADVLTGKLQAEAGMESFAFEIEGGNQISSSLPTMRGRDYHSGLVWSAPVPSAPSVSIAYKHLTGDGPEGGQLEAQGSVSVAGILDPRLTLIGSAGASFGLGDYEQNFWGLGGGVRFAPDGRGRGFGLDLDTRLVSLADGPSSGGGIQGEASYGLRGGQFFATMRPYVGLIRYAGDNSVRRTLGLDVRDTSNSRVKVEVYDQSSDQLRGLKFTLHHRF